MNYDKEKIKDIILTDFLDNQLSTEEHKKIQSLIDQDPELKDFYQMALKSAKEPFEKEGKTEAPAHLWQKIKENIEAPVETPTPFWQPLINFWETIFNKPRVSFAYGSVFAAIICIIWVSALYFNPLPSSYNAEEQVEYLMFLAESPEVINGGFGTTIENYFL